ncbi:MAG TPA: hypothetical protein PLR25_07220 [Planctomycetaceae bacterium]|nr:hypothetical protein [Planctomycetaceae bacterium]
MNRWVGQLVSLIVSGQTVVCWTPDLPGTILSRYGRVGSWNKKNGLNN